MIEWNCRFFWAGFPSAMILKWFSIFVKLVWNLRWWLVALFFFCFLKNCRFKMAYFLDIVDRSVHLRPAFSKWDYFFSIHTRIDGVCACALAMMCRVIVITQFTFENYSNVCHQHRNHLTCAAFGCQTTYIESELIWVLFCILCINSTFKNSSQEFLISSKYSYLCANSFHVTEVKLETCECGRSVLLFHL